MSKIIDHIEMHDVDGIRECFTNGVNPNDKHNEEPLIYELTSEYLRSPRFKECVKAFVDHGLVFADKLLLSVLSDDAKALDSILRDNPVKVQERYTMRCAFTPLQDVTLLHICAEFNHVACAKILVEYGADINAKAGFDRNGFGGQTSIFHTVNQIHNNSFDMLNFLLENAADMEYTVPGLIWGKGYEWETLIPSVNPLSFAMMGLLPQMHRNETVISEIVSLLIKARYNIDYRPTNIPNKYLRK